MIATDNSWKRCTSRKALFSFRLIFVNLHPGKGFNHLLLHQQLSRIWWKFIFSQKPPPCRHFPPQLHCPWAPRPGARSDGWSIRLRRGAPQWWSLPTVAMESEVRYSIWLEKTKSSWYVEYIIISYHDTSCTISGMCAYRNMKRFYMPLQNSKSFTHIFLQMATVPTMVFTVKMFGDVWSLSLQFHGIVSEGFCSP